MTRNDRRPPVHRTLAVLALFVRIDLALKRKGFQPVYDRMVAAAAAQPVREPSSADAADLRSALTEVRSATRYYLRRREDCLPKAMALFTLLRRRGVAADLCIGVRKYPFGAHAWVEYQGRPLDQPAAEVAEFHVLSRAAAR
jgi:hypothetical protein